jgi:hypothetical protein
LRLKITTIKESGMTATTLEEYYLDRPLLFPGYLGTIQNLRTDAGYSRGSGCHF